MMKILTSFYIVALLFVGCSSSAQDPVQAHAEITALEDSISKASLKLVQGEKMDTLMINRLKSKLVNFYQTFPENEYAPEYLDKLHMLAIGQRDYETGMRYADTLIKNYKDYIQKNDYQDAYFTLAYSYNMTDLSIMMQDTALFSDYLLNRITDLQSIIIHEKI